MRFGRTLELSLYWPWRDNYIDYARLKKLLRDDDSAPSSPSTQTRDQWTEEDESKFVDELVNVQLEKVHQFHRDTYEKLRDRTAACEAKLDTIAVADQGEQESEQVKKDAPTGVATNGLGLFRSLRVEDDSPKTNSNGKKRVPSEQERQNILKQVWTELDEISKETNELEKYSRINYTGFLKAAKKHDRKRGESYRVRPLLQVRLAALPFNKEDYSPLLYRLSAMYGFVRQHLEGGDKPDLGANDTKKDQDEYQSHKFWVHPDNLLEVKTMILRRLPVLVYNPQTSKVAEGSQPDPSITSIYFDNPAFSLYTNKVEMGEASSLRLRWYGQLNNRPEILVEKKLVEEDNTSHESRLSIKEKYVQRFIKNEYHMEKQIRKMGDRLGTENEAAKNYEKLVKEVQTFIKDNNLQPVLRANYTRTAFQIPGDDRVRISLDTDMAFIREDAIDADRPCRDPESWHRTDIDGNELEYPFSSIRKGEISRFPFVLLEIKIRNDSKRSEWIEDLMNSHLVKEAPRFSKFVHGVAQLFEDYVNTFPFWLSQMETDIRRDPQQAFVEEQAKRQKAMDDQFAVGSLLKSTPSLTPLRREPGVLSPVGSPDFSGNLKPSSLSASTGKRPSRLSTTAVASDPTRQSETAEEPDDDETGEHVHGAAASTGPSGLKSLFPSFSTSKYAQAKRSHGRLPPGVSKPTYWIKDQGTLKVEGKVWLANQRTFIKWQHVAVLLASLALGLFNAAGANNPIARALAVVYTIVAVFAGAWGYGVYMWRTRLIERRSGKDFDAVAGPIVVCVALIVALLVNFGFKYQIAMEERRNRSSSSALNQSAYLTKFGEL